MNYTKIKPCNNCPFRNDIKPYLRSRRVEQIRDGLVRGDFPCHKTTVESESDDGEMRATDESLHCAGALILLERLNEPSQMMRICERLGMYDRRKLDMDSPIFESWEEMRDAQEE